MRDRRASITLQGIKLRDLKRPRVSRGRMHRGRKHMNRIITLVIAAALTLATTAVGARAQAPARRPASGPAFGINLAGVVDWTTELPFVDVFRTSRRWISQRQGEAWGRGPELELDDRGWVKRLEPGCYAETPICTIASGHYPGGRYIVQHEGSGLIEAAGSARVVERAPGRLVFDVDPSRGTMFLRLMETDPANPVRNIRVIMPGHAQTFEQAPFRPGFLDRWRSASCIRFMDWMSTNGSRVQRWSERPRVDDATWTVKGVPVEVMVRLCNELDADGWFCIPHAADDEYVREFATALRAGLEAERRVYVELSNEVWNGSFAQNRYARDRAREEGIGPADRPWEGAGMWQARRSVEVFAIFDEVFGEKKGQPGGRLVRVLASQASNMWWSESILLPAAARGGRAADFADALAIAPYVSMILSPRSNPSSDDVAGWTVDRAMEHVRGVALPRSIESIGGQSRIAAKFGLSLIAYEAGQHLVGAGGGENNDELTALLLKANRDERMGPVYDEYFAAWERAGGGLLCYFSSTGRWSKWGSWGLTQHSDDEIADYPRAMAVERWRERLRR